jgi:hypothetical protein
VIPTSLWNDSYILLYPQSKFEPTGTDICCSVVARVDIHYSVKYLRWINWSNLAQSSSASSGGKVLSVPRGSPGKRSLKILYHVFNYFGGTETVNAWETEEDEFRFRRHASIRTSKIVDRVGAFIRRDRRFIIRIVVD